MLKQQKKRVSTQILFNIKSLKTYKSLPIMLKTFYSRFEYIPHFNGLNLQPTLATQQSAI